MDKGQEVSEMSQDTEFDNEKWLNKAKITPEWKNYEGRWAAPQHYTCSYMAMFPPQLPHYFIRNSQNPAILFWIHSLDVNSAVQAMSQNRIGIGNDLNVLAYVLTKGNSHPILRRY